MLKILFGLDQILHHWGEAMPMLTKPKKVRSWEKNLMSWIAWFFFFPVFWNPVWCPYCPCWLDFSISFLQLFFFGVADSFLFKAFFKDNSRSADFVKNHYTVKDWEWALNWIGATFGIQNEANFTMAHVGVGWHEILSRWKTKLACWSAWDWGLVGQWKLKLTAPCCCIVLDGRSRSRSLGVAQRRHCVLSEVLKNKPVSIYIYSFRHTGVT